jgi:8-oxo-dGTP pyrophosphatase MutT (NUDIX family)
MIWQRLRREAVIDTKWLRVFRDAYRLPSGRQVDDYYIIERSDFVLVVAGNADSVALVRQFRPATDRFYWSLPAGYIDAGETPEQAALRELREETGIQADSARLLAELHALPGYLKSSAFVVLCVSSCPVVRVKDTDEIAEARLFTWTEVLEMIRVGLIDEMQAVSALLLVRQFDQQRLRVAGADR